MKKIIFIVTILVSFVLSSCNNLDLYPLSQPTSDSWYSNEIEIEMAIKDLYKQSFWPMASVEWTDDYTYRDSPNLFLKSQLNGQTETVTALWSNMYKAIGRANTILSKMDRAKSMGVSEAKIKQYSGEVNFIRACMYSKLVFRFGDVVWVDKKLSIKEAFKIGRTSKSEIIPKIYHDFDVAIDALPVSRSGKFLRATKGAALALKARFALYMNDYDVCESAAKSCIDLKNYTLHKDFSEVFLASTKNSEECIFVIPRSVEYESYISNYNVLSTISRNSGGWASADPSWALLASFLCTDGLPIDESPLFDSHKPFENRDPRCAATIVPFGSKFLGFEYNPHPNALQVMNYNTGKLQKNNDNRANAQYASFNGLIWKKGIDELWLQNGFIVAPDKIIIRYADVLLMFAEARIEQNKINQETIDAINLVRARAYGVDITNKEAYPEVTIGNQKILKRIVRCERRMEFAKEGLRYNDLIRWRIAGEAINSKDYGMLYPSSSSINEVVNKGCWFWSHTPIISENGIPNFDELFNAGTIQVLSERTWDDRQYLWPIPTKEKLINENLTQNDGY